MYHHVVIINVYTCISMFIYMDLPDKAEPSKWKDCSKSMIHYGDSAFCMSPDGSVCIAFQLFNVEMYQVPLSLDQHPVYFVSPYTEYILGQFVFVDGTPL